MNECIFCKIINGEIPSHKIYEDENVYAFLDITPSTIGHTLVIPKEHHQDIYELPPYVAADLFGAIPKIANAIKGAFNPIGLNVVNNNQMPYQSVFHYHVHLIPRYEDDAFQIHFPHLSFEQEEFLKIKDAIIKKL